jgi:hypothetical protein
MAITPTYSWPTPDDTDLVKDGAEAIRDLALAIESTVSALGSKRIEAFTASGTWTVPTGVTYAIAHIRGGGGGVGDSLTGGTGGNSSVAFAGGTITALGGGTAGGSINAAGSSVAGKDYSGNGANKSHTNLFSSNSTSGQAENGSFIVAGDSVTPAASITVTVGAGGAAGTFGAAGGSGYVYIEYYE